MTFQQIDQSPTTVLKLGEMLNISCAIAIHRTLLDAVQGRAKPILDLSGVEQCDTAAAQVLCSALQTGIRCGKPFRVTGISEAVRNTFAVLGLPLAELAERDSITQEGMHSGV